MSLITKLNERAFLVLEKLMDNSSALGCTLTKQSNGTTIIDAGVEVPGSMEAGRIVGEVCLAGLGTVKISEMSIGDLTLPAAVVETEHVRTATLCSQYAGWTINVGKYFGMASGPARALATVEKLFKEFDFKDSSDVAVILLETRRFPPENVTEYIARKCGVSTSDLYCIIAPTACKVGSVQISARIVEVGAHKLHELKFDPAKIKAGKGMAPIAPVVEKDTKAMGITNDCILYAGQTFYDIEPSDDDDLDILVQQVPSSSSSQYGTPFYELFKSFDFDFYKVDPLLFSPAKVTLRNTKTGDKYQAGALNAKVLRHSLGRE
ncbi:methenyltetrahydromethanopterin cyclohydrolase [Candidatus Thorarchaeota archaeon]|nr:MAG: methenyltetrahydromethanopterin cyclohydrolase [Candidatus Thorarchaeota archaeon]